MPVVLALREAKEEIELTVRDEDGHAACVRCPAVRDAVPLSGERCLVQLKKPAVLLSIQRRLLCRRMGLRLRFPG